MKLRPIDLARELDVSVGTIRNWTDEYAEFLSLGGRGEGGRREFEETDVQIIRYIAQLRNEKMLKPQIVERLHETSVGETETLPTNLAQQPPDLPTNPQEILQNTPQQLVVLDAIDTVMRRVERLERRQWDGVMLFALGVIAGAGIFLLAYLFMLAAGR